MSSINSHSPQRVEEKLLMRHPSGKNGGDERRFQKLQITESCLIISVPGKVIEGLIKFGELNKYNQKEFRSQNFHIAFGFV